MGRLHRRPQLKKETAILGVGAHLKKIKRSKEAQGAPVVRLWSIRSVVQIWGDELMSKFIWASALMATLLMSGAALAQDKPGPCVDCMFFNPITGHYNVYVEVPEVLDDPIFEVTATAQGCSSTFNVNVSNNPYAFFIQDVEVDCPGKSPVDEVIFAYGDVNAPKHLRVRLEPEIYESTVLDFIEVGFIYLFLDTPVIPTTKGMKGGGVDLRLTTTDKPRR